MMDNLQQRIIELRQRIDKAARANGRTAEDITMLAVSKTVDVEIAEEAYNLGVRDFGENRVQEFKKKKAHIPDARWHMIGRMQTNKVKDVVGKAFLIHSMDRWNLAEELDKRGQYLQIEVPVLLQVNVSGEEQKAGVEVKDIENFLDSAGQLSSLRICGFMTMAPLSSNSEESRPVFKELFEIYSRLQKKEYSNVNLKYLSMGMTQDFEVAIEEGSNIVRIGRALFA